MSDLQKYEHNILQQIIPRDTPQVSGGSGMISDFFILKKLDRMNRSSKNEMEIMQNKVNAALNVMRLMHEITVYQDKIEFEREVFKHQKKMMRNDREYREAEIKKIKLEAEQLKDQIKQTRANFVLDSRLKEFQVMEAEYSAKTTELEYKLRLRALEAEYDR